MPEPTASPTTPASEPQKLTWDAPDGKHYEGSAEELFKISSERYNNLFPEYSKIKSEAQLAREQLELVQQATQGVAPQPQNGGFDNQKYWQLMQSNPLEAQRYANQYDPDYQRAVTDLRNTRQNQEAAMFRAEHPDFDANEANVEKLAQVCQELFPGSDVYSSRQISAAHALAFAASQKQEPRPNQPPAPPAAGSSMPSGTPDISQMDQNQLRAYIASLESQQR